MMIFRAYRGDCVSTTQKVDSLRQQFIFYIILHLREELSDFKRKSPSFIHFIYSMRVSRLIDWVTCEERLFLLIYLICNCRFSRKANNSHSELWLYFVAQLIWLACDSMLWRVDGGTCGACLWYVRAVMWRCFGHDGAWHGPGRFAIRPISRSKTAHFAV